MPELELLRLIDACEKLEPIGDRIFPHDITDIKPYLPYLNLKALIEPQTRFFRTYFEPFAQYAIDRANAGDKSGFPQPITGKNTAFVLDCGQKFVKTEAGRLAVEACEGEFDSWMLANTTDGELDVRKLLTAARITPQYLHKEYNGVTLPWNEGQDGLVEVSDLGEYFDIHFPQTAV